MEFTTEILGRLEALRAYSGHFHEQCVGAIAEEIALLMGIKKDRSAEIGVAAQLHDVGKLVLPDAVLNKPGMLSTPEREMTKMHSKLGYEILKGSNLPNLDLAALIALHHHEYADGSGYPDGLHGSDIPVEVRIVTVADVYSALREPRTYKPIMPHDQAIAILTQGDERVKPQLFDENVLHAVMASADRISLAYLRIDANATLR